MFSVADVDGELKVFDAPTGEEMAEAELTQPRVGED